MGRTKLTDPTLGLAHGYREGRFHQPPGVEVMGAGIARVNGWYHRREANEGPPSNANFPRGGWAQLMANTGGRPWYEKDDGCYIFWYYTPGLRMYAGRGSRYCRDARNHLCYDVRSMAALPPAEGWQGYYERRPVLCDTKSPAPTLRVVS